MPKTAGRERVYFSEAKAKRVIDFLTRLKHTKGEWAGKPFQLQKWQIRDIVAPIFGRVHKDGMRAIRTALVFLPRKNGKTELSAGLALSLLLQDGEPGAEIYTCAGDREQASIVFNAAATMVGYDPYLRKRLKVIHSSKRIIDTRTGGFCRALSAEAFTKHGLNPSGVIFDELHVQPNRDLWDTMQTAMGARRQPLTIAITTAGFDRNSICYGQYDYARKVRDRIVDDPTFWPVLYGMEDGEDWTSRKVWARVNPNLGISLKPEFLESEFRKAEAMPGFQNTFRRLYLNQWTSSDVRWMPMDKWDTSAGVVDPSALLGRECYGGLDLSSTIDVTAFVAVFPFEGGYKVLPHFWIPADNIEARVKRDRVPYDVWVRQGLVRATPGDAIDYAFVERDILEFATAHNVREIAYDPWNSSEIIQRLSDKGLTMVPIRQGFASASGPMKQAEALIYQGHLHHGGHPILRWMADNVQAAIDPAGNIKPDKGKSREKIDGIVALIMALGRAAMRGNKSSVYEGRGIVTLQGGWS